jgi:hypothetical protein
VIIGAIVLVMLIFLVRRGGDEVGRAHRTERVEHVERDKDDIRRAS